MTQEQKDFLLKDLCARLPYGVKVQSTFYNCDGTIWKYEIETLTAGLLGYPIKRYKPYLFPISSMTERQNFEINEILGGNFEIDKYGITDLIRNKRTTLSYLELNALFEYFNKNHFDYRSLIEKGLALDATGLNIY